MSAAVDLAAITTPDGILIAAALATTLAEMAKRAWPALDAEVSGARLVFGLSALLYLWAGIAYPPADAAAAFALFAAWAVCASGAVGIHSTITHIGSVRQTGG